MSDEQNLADQTADHQTARPQGPDGTFVPTLETAERDAAMARRRAEGVGYRQIAREFGLASHTSAREGVQRCLNAVRAEAGEEARLLELARLDSYIERIERDLQSGRAQLLPSIDRLRKLSEDRRRLLGLDAPTKQDLTVHQADPMDTALGELIREARARQALEEQALKEGSE